MDIRQQLEHLRRTVAQIDRKYAQPSPAPAAPPPPSFSPRGFVEDLISGQVVETAAGRHFEAEKLYPRGKRHGGCDIADLAELPPDLLAPLSEGAIASVPPERWAFLDTETTGIAGGSGTCAFLVGVGSIGAEGFRVRQFFMRDFAEEASMLSSLAAHLSGFEVLITYNGKSYDQPLRAIVCNARGIRFPAWSISICFMARAVCSSCVSKAAALCIWRSASWGSSARAICPAK
jgi:hypothetical protein